MRYLNPLLIALVLFGCKIKEKTSESIRTSENVSIKVSDTLINGFDLKAIPIEFHLLTQYDTISVTDPTTASELRVWKNKYGELEAECEQKDQLIEKVRVDTNKSTEKEKSKEVSKTLYKYDKWTFIPWGVIILYLLWRFAKGRVSSYLNQF